MSGFDQGQESDEKLFITQSLRNQKNAPVFIKKIEVTRLFNEFNYVISLPKSSRDPEPNIGILYGENGSGKTTLLSMVYHLLSPKGGRGHRAALTDIPFEQVRIELNNGSAILAHRSGGSIEGEYDYSLTELNGKAYTTRVVHDGNRWTFKDQVESQSLMNELSRLNIAIYNVSANRHIESDYWDNNIEKEKRHRLAKGEETGSDDITEALRQATMIRAIRLAARWIERKVHEGTSKGIGSVDNIISNMMTAVPPKSTQQVEDLKAWIISSTQRLRDLRKRSELLAENGLASPIHIDQMIASIDSSNKDRAEVLEYLLEAYAKATKARFDELDQVLELTSTFVNALNSFYVGKRIAFTLGNGFIIRKANGLELDPTKLSSGEQQILILFCYTLLSREQNSIFIIDEPELSLNVKWQRKFIGTLQEIVKGSSVQFLFATHSLQILAKHREKTIRLTKHSDGANAS